MADWTLTATAPARLDGTQKTEEDANLQAGLGSIMRPHLKGSRASKMAQSWVAIPEDTGSSP